MYDFKVKIIILGFILIVLIIATCLLGIITNILVIYTITHKKTRKELKHNHYKYMVLNSVISCLIFLIHLFGLLNECQGINTIYCSSVRKYSFFQFYKIIFEEYLSNSLRLLSNFVYVGFALNRLSLIGKDHGKLVNYVSKLTINQFLYRVIVPCLALPIPKIFRYSPNYYDPDENYPMPFFHTMTEISTALVFVYFAFNILFDVINYVAFLFVNLCVDINLIRTLRKVLDEKFQNQLKSGESAKEEAK